MPTVRRPDAAGPSDRERWHDYVYLRDNPAGSHRELWHHVAGCRRWLVVSRDTRTHEIERVELRERRWRGRGTQVGMSSYRLACGRPHRSHAKAVGFTFDGRAVLRASRRHAGVGAARQRRAAGRPLVQVSPAARHSDGRSGGAECAGRAAGSARGASRTRGRRRSSCYDGLVAAQPEPLAVAALRPAVAQRVGRAGPGGGLLLQDLHVAGALLGEGLRAADPPRGGARARHRAQPIPIPTRRRICTATCWWSAAVRPGLMAALAAGRTGARVVLCEEDFRLGGRLLADDEMVGWMTGRCVGERDRGGAAAHSPTCGSCGARPSSAAYDGGTFARCRAGQRPPRPTAKRSSRGSGCWRIVARQAVLAAGAIERPLVFGNNDRPGVMLAGAVRTYLNRFAAVPGRRAVVFANNDDASRTVQDLAHAGVDVVAVVDTRGRVRRSAYDGQPMGPSARLIAGGQPVAHARTARRGGSRHSDRR